jgi:hypothetical protein
MVNLDLTDSLEVFSGSNYPEIVCPCYKETFSLLAYYKNVNRYSLTSRFIINVAVIGENKFG